MISILMALLWALRTSFRSRVELQLEVLALRQQIQVLERSRRGRPQLSRADRVFWVWLARVWTEWRRSLIIVQPATVLAWHRQGFRWFWRWKSRRRTGRPPVPTDVRALIRTMSEANPLWGAPRIHGELLKLSIAISQTSVAKYIVRRRRPPSQTCSTFLTNHRDQLMAVDLFVVPTVTYRLLFVLVLLVSESAATMSPVAPRPHAPPRRSLIVQPAASQMARPAAKCTLYRLAGRGHRRHDACGTVHAAVSSGTTNDQLHR